MLGIHVFLGGVTALDELVRRVFDQLLKNTYMQSWFSKLKELFGDFIQEVRLFNISISFRPPDDRLEALVRDFPDALAAVVKKLEGTKRGLLVVLDDLNGLADQPEFANWYKSVVAHVATNSLRLPVLMVLCGLPERRDSLSRHQSSLLRIFRVSQIERLSNAEVEDFYWHAFQKVGLTVQQGAMRLMVDYCNGLPMLMQEIGDATYWANIDPTIDRSDAAKGIVEVARNVGKKYLDPSVYRAIRSRRYRAILDKLVDPPRETFDKAKVEQRLTKDERKVFSQLPAKDERFGSHRVRWPARPRGIPLRQPHLSPVYASV